MGLDMYLEARKFTSKEYFSPELYASLAKAIDKPEMDYLPSITVKQLITLKTMCNSVVREKNLSQAVAVLPTQDGFFFGNTEYNEYYFSDLEDTMKQIDFVLENYPDEEGWSFIYHSSW